MAEPPSLDWLSRVRALLVRMMLSIQRTMAEDATAPEATRDPARHQADAQLLAVLATRLREVTEAINTHPVLLRPARARAEPSTRPLAEAQQQQTWRHRPASLRTVSDTGWSMR
ncbi:hypothetical protein ABTY61_32350 [Kitasatospora sp. NPDC096128]|uniref:hypothetical protein n=1 Tax=Kitasatospora sp. NPDC096128 TaxID=3155547 RepID=UPI0033215CA7